MTASRTIIVPPYRAAGTIPLAVVAGAVSSLAILGIPTIRSAMRSVIPPGWENVVDTILVPVVVFGPVVGFSIALARRIQRKRLHFLAGLAFMLAQLLAASLVAFARYPVENGSLVHPSFIAIQAVFGVIGGGISLATLWLIRTVLFTVTEQDGGYCWRCGYQLGAPAIAICPECATPRDEMRYRLGRTLRTSDAARRCAKPVFIVLLVVVCVVLPLAVYHGYPVSRFLFRFGASMDAQNRVPTPIVVWNSQGQRADSCEAVGVLVRINDGTARVLIVSYNPRPPRRLPPMQVQLGIEFKFATAGSTVASISYGLPLIVCDLNDEQADYVARNGLPGPLMREFTATADRLAWAAAPSVGDPRLTQAPDIRIMPEPFFPSAAAAAKAAPKR